MSQPTQALRTDSQCFQQSSAKYDDSAIRYDTVEKNTDATNLTAELVAGCASGCNIL
jgi:hypothetical protein